MKGQTIDTPVKWIHEDSTRKLVSEIIPKSNSIMQKSESFLYMINELEPCCFETENGDQTYYPKNQVDPLINDMYKSLKVYETTQELGTDVATLAAEIANREYTIQDLKNDNDILKNQVKAMTELTNKMSKRIKVLKAYTEGKQIQCKAIIDELWYDCNPIWDWNRFEYRVKPESCIDGKAYGLCD